MMWCRLLLGVALMGAIPGCVVFEIRDELKASNRRIDALQGQMDEVLVTMRRIDGTMAEVQGSIKTATATVASSDATLKDMQGQMEPIRISLRRVDDELRAVVQVVTKTADKVPFVDLKPDQGLPAPQAPTEQTTPQRPVKVGEGDGAAGATSRPGS